VQLPDDFLLDGGHHLLELDRFSHQLASPGQEQATGFCELQSLTSTIEQRLPDVLLQGFDMVAHSGLGDVQLLCCLREILAFGGMDEYGKSHEIKHRDFSLLSAPILSFHVIPI
jgi:hypothetical protein